MRSSRQGAIPSELGELIDELDAIQDRLHKLEVPSGEALNQTVAKLQALVTDIQAELDAYMAGRYTNGQIDAKDAAVAAQINPAIAATLAGNVTVAGVFYNPPAYSFDITYTRRGAWVGNDGRLGYASSSREKKTAIRDADEETLARLLDVVPRTFYYRPEIARRTRLRINQGADYRPKREVGLIAEELDEAGLGDFVIYDERGKPEGIEYSMLTVALHAAARLERTKREALEHSVAEIRAALGLESTS